VRAAADYRRVLVIKHGALGDVIQALGPMAAIRAAHPTARITVLTTAPYAGFLALSPYADAVWTDPRPPWWDAPGWLRLRRALRAEGFERVYDLQTSSRTQRYFRLLGPGPPEWSGVAPGCSHPHRSPARDTLHTLERQAEQLALAGIVAVPPPRVDWVVDDGRAPAIPDGAVLLAPGGAAHRLAKRWPIAAYARLARRLVEAGRVPVVLGTAGEAGLGQAIAAAGPGILDLTGRTRIVDLVLLARHARAAVGNDTGPMHAIAAAGCPSTVLFSAASDPDLCAPRGAGVTVLRVPDLALLPVEAVLGAMEGM